jgi:TolB-like protein
MSGDPEQEYFVDGIVEDIITTLSKIPNMFVISRTSTYTYKDTSVAIKQVALEQGVRYVLEGSVRRGGSRVRITAQLIDAETGHHLWADHYDRDLGDIFAVQDDVTEEIVTALDIKLSHGEQSRIWRKRAGNPESYAEILRARELYNRFSKHLNAQAVQIFEQVLEKDPNFASATIFLGWAHADQARWHWSPSREHSLQLADDLASKALALDETLAEAHACKGYICLLRRDFDNAMCHVERAIRASPSGADAHLVFAIVANYAGQTNEALASAMQAVRLSPLAQNNYLVELGHAFCLLRRFEDAIPSLTRVLREEPTWQAARAHLIVAYWHSGRLAEARAEATEILAVRPRFSLQTWAVMHPYQNKADLELMIASLRKAGLPE